MTLKTSLVKLLELINIFRGVAEYKINTQKLNHLSIYNNKHTEKETRDIIPFTVT